MINRTWFELTKIKLRRCIRALDGAIALTVFALAKWGMRERRIHIVVFDPRYFGHQCLEPEVFWDDVRLSRESGSKDIWMCCLGKKSSANNKYLWTYMRSQLPTLPSWLVTDLEYWQSRRRGNYLTFLPASIYRLNFLTKSDTILPSSLHLMSRREALLSQLSDSQRPYVVFTIRASLVSYDPNDPRNRSVTEFLPSMNVLTELGFNVVRVMSQTNERISSGNRHILDWEVLRDGKPGDEFAILSGARFVVSTTTGGDCLALAYRKPVLYLDSARPYLVFLGTELSTFQVPQLIDVDSGSELSMKEILERRLGWVGDSRKFADAGVQIVNSSPEEITEHVVEYVNYLPQATFFNTAERNMTWRNLLFSYHGKEISERHGQIRAQMLPSSIRRFVDQR